MVPALTVVLAGCVVAGVAGFGSAGIEDTAAAPIVDRPPPSLAADAEVANSPQTTVLANAAVDSADAAAPAAAVTVTDTRAVSDEPEPTVEAAATSLTAIHQIAVSHPSVATPNARVAHAFSAIPLNVTTVLANVGAALPAPVIEAKSDTRSANVRVADAFSDAAPDAVMPSDVTSSPQHTERFGRAFDLLDGRSERNAAQCRQGYFRGFLRRGSFRVDVVLQIRQLSLVRIGRSSGRTVLL